MKLQDIKIDSYYVLDNSESQGYSLPRKTKKCKTKRGDFQPNYYKT